MDRWKVLLGGDYLSEDCQWRNKINSDITHREKWYNSPSHRTRTQVTFLFRGILKLWYFSSKLMVELYFIPIYAQHDWLNKFSQAISAVHYGKDEKWAQQVTSNFEEKNSPWMERNQILNRGRAAEIVGLSPILSWPKIIFSECVC